MDAPLHSQSWYRISQIRPRLRAHARINRHAFRGEVWYVLNDRASGRFHRFSPQAYLIISLMNGQRTVADIWDIASARLGDDALTQDDVVQLLFQLHQSDVLHTDVVPDVSEIVSRGAAQRRRRLVAAVGNPLSIRVSVFDPDRFLTALMPLAGLAFGRIGALLIATLIGWAGVQAVMHWNELGADIGDRVLISESLLLLLATYPLVKALHELGHGLAVKRWGGAVHEMGLMFLIFMPVPYVDASDASAFPDKWRRAAVGAAGIIVELVLASLAMIVWLSAEPGLIRALAFNVMLIGGVSTLLFNGNPLLRFDGYYVLCDLLEIPNLGARANRYVTYLIQRGLFGVRTAASPVTARGEGTWFLVYAISAFIYRMTVMVTIILLIGSKFFVIGVILAIWSAFMSLVLPIGKAVWFVLASPKLKRHRARAIAVSGLAASSVAALLLAVPLPFATISEGVVRAPDEASLLAEAEGSVSEIIARPGDLVKAGDVLIRLEDPILATKIRVLQAQADELSLRYDQAHQKNRFETRLMAERHLYALAELDLARERGERLNIVANRDGRFLLPDPADLPGRFVRKGDRLGYVVDPTDIVIRVLVPQDDADLVRSQTHAVALRYAQDAASVQPARIARIVPDMGNDLPSPALSTEGGGQFSPNPKSSRVPQSLERTLHLELLPSKSPGRAMLGGRVFVRFDHGDTPIAPRLYRSVRQVFLKHFNA